uniref:Uncharacterized protein n=1 Tax=Anguilla anguilla TaxID=7936 RepID=A0A0E9XTN5_ANGAN
MSCGSTGSFTLHYRHLAWRTSTVAKLPRGTLS